MAPQQGTGGMGQQDHPRQLGSSALGQLSDALLTLAQCDGRRKRFYRSNRLRLILIGKQEREKNYLHDSVDNLKTFIDNEDLSMTHIFGTIFTVQKHLSRHH